MALARPLLVAWLSVGAGTAIAGIDIDELSFRHGIAFFHELKYPSDFTHLDYLNPDAPKGGTLVLSTGTAFNNLAPLVEGAVGVPTGFGFSSDTLLIRAGDEISAFYGRLADGIAITDDRLAIVFRIHPDARWRDGVPITSDDVVFTLEARRQQIQFGMYLDFIRDVEALDDRHVAVHPHTPLTLNNVIMVQFTPILPAHYWRQRDPTQVTLEPPVSSGPYEIADIKQARHVTWKRDPDYWGRDIPVNRGRYNFDTVRYDLYRDAIVTREAFRKGLIDIFTEPDVRYWHGSYDIPALDKGWIRKIHRKFGIEGGIQLVDSTRYTNLARDFQFDAVLMNRDILMPPGIELRSTYHSEAATLPMSRNLAGIADPVLGSLVIQANLATTLDQMVAACRAIDRVLLWQYYQIPLYAVGPRRTVHWDKFGIPAFEPDYWPAFPDGWWYDREKAARIVVND